MVCLVYTREGYGEVEAPMITPLPDEAQGSHPSQVDWRSWVKVWSSLDDDVSQGDLLSPRDRKPIDFICLVRGSTSAISRIAPSLRRLLHALLFDTFHVDGVYRLPLRLTSIIPLVPLRRISEGRYEPSHRAPFISSRPPEL